MSFKNAHDQLELSDARAMRAVAHPIRIELLRVLSSGPKTATECAELVGDSPQSCSYHLRTLAKYGFIEPAETTNGKERPWQKVARGLRWSADSDPEAARTLSATFLSRDFRLLERYLAAPPETWPQPMYSQTTLRLTHAEAEELGKRIWALLEPYFTTERKDAPADALDVWYVGFGVPYER